MTFDAPNPECFRTTRWTQVLAARGSSPEAQLALRDLCQVYYPPVERFVRSFRGDQEAQDLTQEFFTNLLDGAGIGQPDRARGRFRSYLLGAVKHFLSDLRKRDQAIKRGGGHVIHSASGATDGRFEAIADPHGLPPDAYFDRQWALTVVDRAIVTLRHEAEVSGTAERFDILKQWLTAGEVPESTNAVVALGLSPGALKIAVHRLRQRFRHVVREIIMATLDDPAEVSDELGYLISALTADIRH